MTYYLIGYDLNKCSDDHDKVRRELQEQFGAKVFLDLTTTMVVDCDLYDIRRIDKYFLPFLKKSGSLFIIPFGESINFEFSRFVENGKEISLSNLRILLLKRLGSRNEYQRRTPRTS